MSRIIDDDLSQQWMFPPSLDDMLPADHPARFVRDFVDQLDMRSLSFRMPQRTGPGAPAYSSQLLLRVWLLGWMQRVRTPRKLEAACRDSLAMIWLIGLNNAPDHNTIWRFWKHNQAALKNVFRQSVRVAASMGLVSMVLHAIDGTKIRPASSSRTALHKEDLLKLLAKMESALVEMEKEIEANQDEDFPSSLPERLQNARTRRDEIAAQLKQLDDKGLRHMLPAEPEANMIRSNNRTEFNYNAQAVVDSSHSIIVGDQVVTDVLDIAQLAPMVQEAKANLAGAEGANQTGLPELVAADGGYANQEQIGEAEKLGAQVTVPVGKRGELDNKLHSHYFAHDESNDCLVCPATGQALAYVSTREARERHLESRVYRCPVTDQCPLGKACTKNKRGREIEVTIWRRQVLAQVEKRNDGRLKQAMRERMSLVEPVFGWLKEQLGLRRFNVRGLEKVRCQWSLACAVSNLTRMVRAWQGQLRGKNAPPTTYLAGPGAQLELCGKIQRLWSELLYQFLAVAFFFWQPHTTPRNSQTY